MLLLVSIMYGMPNPPTSADWRGVSAVREEMDKGVADPSLLGCREEGLQVSNVAMHPAITDKTKEVETTVLTLHLLKGSHQL